MDSLDVNDYKGQLMQLCVACKRENKCKDKTPICAFKKLAFLYAKKKYKKDMKVCK